jgi:hypothetical protein
MKRTAFGLSAMLVSFLLGTAIALGSLVAMGGKLDSAALTALSVPTLLVAGLVACLDPLAILLEIVAIVLIAVDSRQVGGLHRRLAWTAAILFVIWAVANVAGFVPLSLVGMRRGALALVKAGQLVKAGAALLQYSVPFLMVFGLTRKWPRVLLWLALVMTAIGNFGVVVLPISGMQLAPIEVPGQTMYAPQFAVDYGAGVYPFLLGMGYIGGALYLVVYAFLAWRTWRSVSTGEGP